MPLQDIYTFFTELLWLVHSFYRYFMGSDPDILIALSNFTNLHPAIVPLMNANDCYSIFKYGLKCFISTCTFVPGAELAGGFPSFIASNRSAFVIAKSMKVHKIWNMSVLPFEYSPCPMFFNHSDNLGQ